MFPGPLVSQCASVKTVISAYRRELSGAREDTVSHNNPPGRVSVPYTLSEPSPTLLFPHFLFFLRRSDLPRSSEAKCLRYSRTFVQQQQCEGGDKVGMWWGWVEEREGSVGVGGGGGDVGSRGNSRSTGSSSEELLISILFKPCAKWLQKILRNKCGEYLAEGLRCQRKLQCRTWSGTI